MNDNEKLDDLLTEEPKESEDDLLGDLGDSLGLDDLGDFATAEKQDEEEELSSDFAGFAKGFPDWDLTPPKKK